MIALALTGFGHRMDAPQDATLALYEAAMGTDAAFCGDMPEQADSTGCEFCRLVAALALPERDGPTIQRPDLIAVAFATVAPFTLLPDHSAAPYGSRAPPSV